MSSWNAQEGEECEGYHFSTNVHKTNITKMLLVTKLPICSAPTVCKSLSTGLNNHNLCAYYVQQLCVSEKFVNPHLHQFGYGCVSSLVAVTCKVSRKATLSWDWTLAETKGEHKLWQCNIRDSTVWIPNIQLHLTALAVALLTSRHFRLFCTNVQWQQLETCTMHYTQCHKRNEHSILTDTTSS